jgi:site-specific recombinase XerD
VLSNSSDRVADKMDGYLFYLLYERGLSKNTIIHYSHDLSLFMRYMARQLSIEPLQLRLAAITPEHICSFLDYLRDERGNTNRSTKRRLAALRSFFDYIVAVASTPSKPLRNPASVVLPPSAPEPLPSPLSLEDSVSLLRAVRAHGPNPKRDYAIMRLFLHCGARLSEVLELNREHISLEGEFVRLDAFGVRDRLIPLSEETGNALAAYLKARPTVSSPRVFINRNGRPISKGAIYHAIDKCASAASLSHKKVTVSMLRHTCFTLLAKEGFTAEELQTLAGLRRIQTPRAYLRLASKEQQTPDGSNADD